MPVYTYRCENCSHQFDKRQSFSEAALVACPVCRKHALHKVYSPAGVVFKGSGFYVTDKGKSASKTATAKKSNNGRTKKEKVAATKSKKVEKKTTASKKETA